mmetsp:Transcript_18209/g.62626  ORF Transcript_18209/g.62626 Transcript_18209/m.62626 type:complete len:149 (-) Transcript_18209:241-687(-)
MTNGGAALMGTGTGKGPSRAQDAATAAITSPLLEFPINRAKGIVMNIQGGSDMTLQEINAAAEVIYDAVDDDANIIFGAVLADRVQQEVSVTILATGFDLTHVELPATRSGPKPHLAPRFATPAAAAAASGFIQDLDRQFGSEPPPKT